MATLYHLTNEESLRSIMKNGLIPQRGRNSRLVEEQEDYVFMCEERHIPYWQILLDRDYLLKVDAGMPLNCRFYAAYNEYFTDLSIDPSKIKFVGQLSRPKKGVMEKVCLDHLGLINYVCMAVVKYYNDDPDIKESDVKEAFEQVDFIKKNLDFEAVSPEKATEKMFAVKASLNFALSDTYGETSRRIWEMLPLYPKDELTQGRMNLYRFIKSNLDSCSRADTGSWTP